MLSIFKFTCNNTVMVHSLLTCFSYEAMSFKTCVLFQHIVKKTEFGINMDFLWVGTYSLNREKADF